MLKIGHRGAKGYVAENTLASFQKAIDLGCDGIELDVHLSKDGQIVVIHDDTIDRTTSAKGFVNEMTLKELKKYDIPMLQEVFKIVNNNILVNIEIKSYETIEKVIDFIEKLILDINRNYNSILISSFNWEALQKVHSINNKIQIGVLTENDLDKAQAFAKKINAYSINPYFKLLSSEKVLEMHQKGFKIFTWTVNSEEDVTFVKNLKVDAIISDFPDRI